MSPSIQIKFLSVLCGLLLSGHPADASSFLAKENGSPELTSRTTLLSEIEEALGSQQRRATEGRLEDLERRLRPTFVSLPKNAHGRLDHATVRYALHRLFVEKHGWSIRNIEPRGEAWNSSSPTVVLQDRVPAYVQAMFEQRLGHQGVSLHEVAVLAATLENLIHAEALERLTASYIANTLSLNGTHTREEVQGVVDTHMMTHVLGINISNMRSEYVKELRDVIEDIYPSWNATKVFIQEVEQELLPTGRPLGFADGERMIEEIGERYGGFQNKECRALKAELVAIEEKGSGRVPLSTFYGSAIHDEKWQFSESVDYLRQVGALDESNPNRLSVIIPNYLAGPSNCMGGQQSFYSVCCLDECEGLYSHLEHEVAAPDATPAQLASLVTALPSASMPAGRDLPSQLLGRLDEIAELHGGRVPLHGRLFAQWMHHAYPRECQYPFVSGTTSPQQPEAWMAETGLDSSATPEEMLQHIDAGKKHRGMFGSAEDDDICLPWTMEEELIAPPVKSAPAQWEVGTSVRSVGFRFVVIIAAFASLVLGLARSLRSATGVGGLEKAGQRYMI